MQRRSSWAGLSGNIISPRDANTNGKTPPARAEKEHHPDLYTKTQTGIFLPRRHVAMAAMLKENGSNYDCRRVPDSRLARSPATTKASPASLFEGTAKAVKRMSGLQPKRLYETCLTEWWDTSPAPRERGKTPCAGRGGLKRPAPPTSAVRSKTAACRLRPISRSSRAGTEP